MWTYWGASGTWTYDMLEWNDPRDAIFYIILIVVALLAFGLMYCVAGAREWAATGRCCCACGCCGCCGRCCQPGDEEDLLEQQGGGKGQVADMEVADVGVPGAVKDMDRL